MRRISSIIQKPKKIEPCVEWKWEMYPTLIFYDHLRGTQFEPHIPLMKKYNEMFPLIPNSYATQSQTSHTSHTKYEFDSIEEVEGRGNLILKRWLEKQ